jgi:phage recombination protein Bet
MNSTNQIVKMERQVVKIEMQELSQEKIDLIRRMCAKDATDEEFMLFLEICRAYNLNPLLREIWFVKFKGREPSIFTSRDGYLKIAHMSGKLDGIESRVIEDSNGKPYKAVCTVWRKDMSHPFTSEVKFSEYFNPNSEAWRKYPSAMLIKVAEVFALRRAFAISGLVTREEYASMDGVHAEPVKDSQTMSVSVPEQSVVVCTTANGSNGGNESRPKEMTIEQRETLLRTIKRLHKRRRKEALRKLNTFDFVAAEKAISKLEHLDFIDDDEVSMILDLSHQCGLSEDDLRLFLKERYDIADVRDVTRDILDEVLGELSTLCFSRE